MLRVRRSSLPPNVGIIGSRDFPSYDIVRRFVFGLNPGTHVVSGGARGADRFAARAAREAGFRVTEFFPDKKHPVPARFFARNQEIVDASDALVVFSITTDGITPSRGSSDSIRKARKKGIPVIVMLMVNGKLVVQPDTCALERHIIEEIHG